MNRRAIASQSPQISWQHLQIVKSNSEHDSTTVPPPTTAKYSEKIKLSADGISLQLLLAWNFFDWWKASWNVFNWHRSPAHNESFFFRFSCRVLRLQSVCKHLQLHYFSFAIFFDDGFFRCNRMRTQRLWIEWDEVESGWRRRQKKILTYNFIDQ